MPYRRRYSRAYRRRTSRPSNRIIRSATGTVTGTGGTGVVPASSAIVWTADTPCTVTNFRLNLGITQFSGSEQMAYCLLRRPEFNVPSPEPLYFNWPALNDDLYNPTNQVIIAGFITDDASTQNRFSRYSRKMHPGDQIILAVLNPNASSSVNFSFELSFTQLA